MNCLFDRNTYRKSPLVIGLLLILSLTFHATTAQAFFQFFNRVVTRSYGGVIAAKGIVLGDNNKPIWVEYDAKGYIAREIGEAHGTPYENAFVMSGNIYRAYVDAFNAVKQEHPQNHEIITKEQYESQTFTDVNGKFVPKPPLQNNTYSVVVKTADTLYGSSVNPVLHESPLNLLNGPKLIDSSINAVLLSDEDRKVLTESQTNIAYKAAYYTVEDDPNDTNGLFAMGGYQRGDKVWGPIVGARMEMAGGTKDVSGTDGGFVCYYTYLSGPMAITHDSGILATLRLTTFNPDTKNTGYYYKSRKVYGAGTPSIRLINFTIDLSMLAGQGILENTKRPLIQMNPAIIGSVPMGGNTTHYYVKPLFNPQTSEDLSIEYDFDGDGKPDQMEMNAQGGVDVWLGDANPKEDEPDLKRLADFNPDFFDRGLLQEISKTDLEETDIYVFRVSNSQKIAERQGLKPSESNPYHGGGASNETESLVNYRMLMVGPANFYFQGRAKAWQNYQTAMKQDEDLFGIMKDHLKTGELVKVIMVNRSTGYIGSAVTAVGSGANLLSFSPERIVMRPPNLTITAERKYKIEKGLTKNEEKEYRISFEGSGMTDDEVISVTTEFYDWDGTPFPEDLPGFTGRLAKVVQENVLGKVSGQLAEFEIKPGRNTQLIRLPQGSVSKAHYYIHVTGDPPERNPNFEDIGAGEGGLQYRPKYYVPVKVNVFNEEATVALENEYKKKLENLPLGEPEPEKPEPVYASVYRPEMQFSLFDLGLNTLRLEKDIGEGQTETELVDLQANPDDITRLLSTNVLFADLFYDLTAGIYSTLPAFGPGSELVFAVGKEEGLAKVEKNGSVTFNNIDHVTNLDPYDYLAIRLYQNGDSENILWEYAFELLYMTPDGSTQDEVVLSADDTELDLNMIISGYSARKPEDQRKYKVSWVSTENVGSLNPQEESKQSGYFETQLIMPKIKGAATRIEAKLENDGYIQTVRSPLIRVIAGNPHSIQVEKEGQTAIGKIGKVTLTATVRDQWGNLVEDGTPIDFLIRGDADFSSEISTVNGVATAELLGLQHPGEKTITVRSGSVEVEETIEVADVELDIIFPSKIVINDSAPVTIIATTTAGDMDGEQIILRQTHGNLENNLVTISGNSATTTYNAGEFRGPGKILASFAGAHKLISFEVTEPVGGPSLSSAVLVGDQPADGLVTIETDEGDKQFQYTISSTMTIQGEPDEIVPVKIGDLVNPPIEPVLHYSMSLIHDENIFDSFGVIHGIQTNVTSVRESSKGYRGSFKFQSDSGIRVGAHTAIDKDTDIGFSLEFKPSKAEGSLVEYYLRSQKLSIQPDSRLKYEIITDTGTYEVYSNPIALDEWHEVGAHYKDDRLLLEVDGELFSTPASGNLVKVTGPVALEIASGYTGLMTQFRMINWTAPVLMTLPNGETEMDVTIGSDGTAQVEITSTMELGNRFFAEGIEGYRIANNCFIPPAYAQDPSQKSSWWGKIRAGAKKAAITAWKLYQLKQKLEREFARGLLTGDVSTAAGIVGDIALGFVPFGDLRDIAIYSYYLAYDVKDEQGKDKFRKSVYLLSFIGLAADVLIVTIVGEAINGAIAGCKTLVKLIDLDKFMAFYKAFEGWLEKAAAAVNKKDWSIVEKALPFLQLLAAVVIDEQLRNFIFSAINTWDDLTAWIDWLAGYEASQTVASIKPGLLKEILVKEAQAAISPFKQVLTRIINHFPDDMDPKKLGPAVTEAFKSLNFGKANFGQFTEEMYKVKTIIALTNIYTIGGREAIEAVSKFGKLGSRRVDEFLDDLSRLDLSKIMKNRENAIAGGLPEELIEATAGVQEQLTKVLKFIDGKFDKAHSAKGYSHNARCVADAIDNVVGVELKKMAMKILNGARTLGNRQYDYLKKVGDDLVHVECKAWIPNEKQIRKKTREYLVIGKEIADTPGAVKKSKQLFIDLISFKENGFKGFLWEFDKGMKGFDEVFKDTIIDVLQNHRHTRNKMMELLKKNTDQLDDWVEELVGELDNFLKVKN